MKAYIVVFTCAVVRTVHLELCSDMTVKSFLMAFHCFVARHGIPSVLYYNNALTFKAASHELKSIYQILQDIQEQNFCATSHITEEIYSGACLLVGRLLGKDDSDCQTMPQENVRESHLPL